MKGVLILNEFHPVDSSSFIRSFIVVISVGIFGLLCGLFMNNEVNRKAVLSITMIVFIITILLSIIFYNANITNLNKTYYKIYLDETVNIVEFNEKYEVIKQEGKMYIVQERNNKEEGGN